MKRTLFDIALWIIGICFGAFLLGGRVADMRLDCGKGTTWDDLIIPIFLIAWFTYNLITNYKLEK